MSKSKINVVKIPNENMKIENKIKEFPRMPRMYLELIENKDKIKPNLVNKEYDPDEVESIISFKDQKIKKIEPSEIKDNESDESIDEEELEEELEDEEERDDKMEENEEKDDIEEDDEKEEEEELNFSDEDDDEEEEKDEEILSENIEEMSNSKKSSRNSVILSKEEHQKKDEVREKLKEILKDPPRLSDLEQRGEVKTNKVIPNIDKSSIEEEDELKRELLYKFELLKRSYKNIDIPEFTVHSDYKNMNRTYENFLRRVSLDSNVENYRNYLIAGFMIMEFILGSWLKFDMAGFTQQQILNMNQYERLLIELGEKSYVPDDKKWPVELRLLGLIVFNAVVFIIAKMIMSKTGTSLFGLMNAQQSEFQKHKAKRKMKGPNIDLNSIPDLDN